MQKYQSHHIVEAGKIKSLSNDRLMPGQVVFRLDGETGARHESTVWYNRNKPEPGWYYLRYEDGYTSACPAESFEPHYLVHDPDRPLPEHYALLLARALVATGTPCINSTQHVDGREIQINAYFGTDLWKEFLYTAQQVCQGNGDQRALIRHLARLGDRIQPSGMAWQLLNLPDVVDKAAYDGAREDLAMWKRRALKAEQDLRLVSKIVGAPPQVQDVEEQASDAMAEAMLINGAQRAAGLDRGTGVHFTSANLLTRCPECDGRMDIRTTTMTHAANCSQARYHTTAKEEDAKASALGEFPKCVQCGGVQVFDHHRNCPAIR